MDGSAPEMAHVGEIEPSGDYSGIRFEPGKHITSTEQYSQLLAQFASGSLNTSIWNPEVAARIGSYQPVILAIDGQSPTSNQTDNLAFSAYSKNLLWINMPARPQRLNLTGQIYTVSGDVMNHDDYLQPLTDTNNPEGEHLSRMYAKVLAQLKAKEQKKVGRGKIVDPLLILPMGMLIARATVAAVAAASELKNMRETNKPTVSRRQFLHLTSITAIGLLLTLARVGTAVASTLESSTSTTEEGRQFWLDITNIIRPRFVKSEWMNARTALLIDKSQDALDFLGLPKNAPGSAVMGIDHSYEANILTENPVERARAISGWTTNLAASLDDLLEQKGLTQLRKPARNALLNNITSAEVFNINDPGGPDFNPDFPNKIDYYIVPTGRFNSPSVEAAIHNLRI